jgi:hypothetical protein
MSKYEKPIPMSVLARRLAGAALAATLIPGALVTGAVLVPAIASAAVDSDGDGLTDDFEPRPNRPAEPRLRPRLSQRRRRTAQVLHRADEPGLR